MHHQLFSFNIIIVHLHAYDCDITMTTVTSCFQTSCISVTILLMYYKMWFYDVWDYDSTCDGGRILEFN